MFDKDNPVVALVMQHYPENQMVLFIFLTLTFLPDIFAYQANVCKNVSQTGFFTKTSELASNVIVIFDFDISVTFNANNQSFPNTLTISNFTFSNLPADNNNLTFQNLSFTFFGNPHKIINCPSIISTSHCIFEFPNGEIIYFLNYGYSGTQNNIAKGPYLYVNDGIFYNGKTSELWDPSTNLTCNNYQTNLTYGNKLSEICQNFETITSITDPSATKPISITAHYFVTSTSSLLINITLLDSPDLAYIYYVYVGYPFVAFINGSSAKKDTNFSLNLVNEKQYEILFDYNPSVNDAGDGIFKYGGISLGEIIMRNGIFLKNLNQSYTSADPCWTKVAAVPFTNAIYNSSFCCKNFIQHQITSSSSPLSPSTASNKTAKNFEINFYLFLGILFLAINLYS